MVLINKNVARSLFKTQTKPQKNDVIWTYFEIDPEKHGSFEFDEFYDYLINILASNTEWDIKLNVVNASYHFREGNVL